MNKETIECFKILKAYRKRINKQQYRTFKGQILSGNIEGFRKGLFNSIKNKLIKEVI
jgi:hypothetical protein